jgi:hypothetical protein
VVRSETDEISETDEMAVVRVNPRPGLDPA